MTIEVTPDDLAEFRTLNDRFITAVRARRSYQGPSPSAELTKLVNTSIHAEETLNAFLVSWAYEQFERLTTEGK